LNLLTEVTNEDFRDIRRCQDEIEKLNLPPGAIARCGKKKGGKGQRDRVCICIRADNNLDLPMRLGDNIAVDFKTFKTAAEEIQKLSEKSKQAYRCQINTSHVAETIQKHARTLMQKHSNLCIISGSDVKLGDDGETVETSDNGFIELVCIGKGIIPFGEGKFPKTIDSYDVVILEGNFHLGASSISLGCNIGLDGGLHSGSVGPLIKIGQVLGFLTCCHVICDAQAMLNGNLTIAHDEVAQYACPRKPGITFADRICGKVESLIGIENNGTVVDLAKVRLTSAVPDNPNIEIGK